METLLIVVILWITISMVVTFGFTSPADLFGSRRRSSPPENRGEGTD